MTLTTIQNEHSITSKSPISNNTKHAPTKPLSKPIKAAISAHHRQQHPHFVPTGLQPPLGIAIGYPHVAPSGDSSLPPIQNQ